MTKQEKIILLDKWEKERQTFDALKHIVYRCSDCHFKIAVTDKEDPYIQCSVGFHYEYSKTTERYEKIEHTNNKINHSLYLGAPANHICLNCGNALLFSKRKKNKKCDNCNASEIVFWEELTDKVCPICNGKFADGVVFNSNDDYREADWAEDKRELLQAQEKYGIVDKEVCTEEEMRKREEEYTLISRYMSSRFVVESKNNVIYFSCRRSFHLPFSIVVEWDNSMNFGNLVFCSLEFSDEYDTYKEMRLEKEKINRLLQVLDKYKFFSEPNESDRMGFDGSTWNLEVSYGELYKEISVWSPDTGVIYDIGHLLLEYSNPKINGEIY